jgi:hypothetical protein
MEWNGWDSCDTLDIWDIYFGIPKDAVTSGV